MNDHKKEETMLPDWMCSGETYVPSKDKEAFLTKSTKSVLSVLAKMRFYEGKDGKFSATPSLKLFYTLLYIVLAVCISSAISPDFRNEIPNTPDKAFAF